MAKNHSLTKMTIPCTTQDVCPEGFHDWYHMEVPPSTVVICILALPPIRQGGFLTISHVEAATKILNTSTCNSSVIDRKADKFNNTEISVTDTVRYEVVIEYIGKKCAL